MSPELLEFLQSLRPDVMVWFYVITSILVVFVSTKLNLEAIRGHRSYLLAFIAMLYLPFGIVVSGWDAAVCAIYLAAVAAIPGSAKVATGIQEEKSNTIKIND